MEQHRTSMAKRGGAAEQRKTQSAAQGISQWDQKWGCVQGNKLRSMRTIAMMQAREDRGLEEDNGWDETGRVRFWV